MKQSRRATRATGSDHSGAGKPLGGSNDLKPGKFRLEAPAAKSVKLAAAFTEWEKSALDLVKSENGEWLLVIPLPSGSHPYRFIVDGQWWDDPLAAQRAPNPFGTENSVMVVA